MTALRILSSYLFPLGVVTVLWSAICLIDIQSGQSGVKRIPTWSWGAVLGSATLGIAIDRCLGSGKNLSKALLLSAGRSDAYATAANQVAGTLIHDGMSLIAAQRQGMTEEEEQQTIQRILGFTGSSAYEASPESDSVQSHEIGERLLGGDSDQFSDSPGIGDRLPFEEESPFRFHPEDEIDAWGEEASPPQIRTIASGRSTNLDRDWNDVFAAND